MGACCRSDIGVFRFGEIVGYVDIAFRYQIAFQVDISDGRPFQPDARFIVRVLSRRKARDVIRRQVFACDIARL